MINTYLAAYGKRLYGLCLTLCGSSFEAEDLNLEWKHHLPETFIEFAPYLNECRFVGCSHTKEKGCAVLEAVKAGKIQKKRHESYLRLYEELKPIQEWQERAKK